MAGLITGHQGEDLCAMMAAAAAAAQVELHGAANRASIALSFAYKDLSTCLHQQHASSSKACKFTRVQGNAEQPHAAAAACCATISNTSTPPPPPLPATQGLVALRRRPSSLYSRKPLNSAVQERSRNSMKILRVSPAVDHKQQQQQQRVRQCAVARGCSTRLLLFRALSLWPKSHHTESRTQITPHRVQNDRCWRA